MDKGDVILGTLILCVVFFALGLFYGNSCGYNNGYKDGFDKALPLTYARANK